MADTNRLKLRQELVEKYDSLIKSLTRRLGSSEFAYEALHETFVRLEGVPESTDVRSPADYIFRTAINVAKNSRKAQSYRVSAAEIDALIAVSDESTAPAQRLPSPAQGIDVSGLAIVDALSRAWGSTPTPSGKTVWAVIGPENQL